MKDWLKLLGNQETIYLRKITRAEPHQEAIYQAVSQFSRAQFKKQLYSFYALIQKLNNQQLKPVGLGYGLKVRIRAD